MKKFDFLKQQKKKIGSISSSKIDGKELASILNERKVPIEQVLIQSTRWDDRDDADERWAIYHVRELTEAEHKKAIASHVAKVEREKEKAKKKEQARKLRAQQKDLVLFKKLAKKLGREVV